MDKRITGGHSKRRVVQRKEQAILRQEKKDKRTPKDQLKVLDDRFGKDLGAEKERVRLLTLIENSNESKTNEKRTKPQPSNKKLKRLKKQKNPETPETSR